MSIAAAEPSDSDFHLEISSLTSDERIQEVGITKGDQIEEEVTSVIQISLCKKDVHQIIKRAPSDIVLVIDTSGSMMDSASTTHIEAAFNLLEIVIHAVKTVIESSNENDRIAIVTFSDNSHVIFHLCEMNDRGKKEALKSLESLSPGGSTNIWAGLKSGLDILQKANKNNKEFGELVLNKNSALLLLTDGVASNNPPNGHVGALKDYCETNLNGKYPCIISTFGFGYSSDSILLKSLADEGGGMFSFIPDSGFVGTAFINSLSNIFSTFSIDARLTIEPEDHCAIVPNSFIGCQYPQGNESWGHWIAVGSMQIDQEISFIFQITHPIHQTDKFITARIEFTNLQMKYSSSPITAITTSKQNYELLGPLSIPQNQTLYNLHKISLQVFRLKTIEILNNLLLYMGTTTSNKELAQKQLNTLIELIKNWLNNHEADIVSCDKSASPIGHIRALLTDLTGQVTEAISKEEWYRKWGRHYLLSLQRAHALQQSNNFKDPGIQFYGGPLFRKIQNDASDIYDQLPMIPRNISYETSNTSNANIVFNMAAFNNSDAACIHGECTVRLQNGTFKQIQNLKKGDLVQCSRREFGRVLCLVETLCDNKANTEMITFDTGLKITPWHPMQGVKGKWEFPCKMIDGKTVSMKCSSLFNLVIERLVDLDPNVFIRSEDLAAGRCNESMKLGVSGTIPGDVSRNTIVRYHSMQDDLPPLNVGISANELQKDNEIGITTDLVYYDPILCKTYFDSVIINDIPCITLGNGIIKDAVGHHPYFSGDEVIYDLSQCRAFTAGHVIFDIGGIMRNKDTGIVKGFDLSKEISFG